MKKRLTEEAIKELRDYTKRDVAAGFRKETEIAESAVHILSDDYDTTVLLSY